MKENIRELSPERLTEVLCSLGEKSFRAKQIEEWLWKKSALQFDDMTNLSRELRQKLESNFSFPATRILFQQKSIDGTIKCAMALHDGSQIEGVIIPTEKRLTACISSQVGCSLTCKFCATGRMGRLRNLEGFEIYDQFILLNQLAKSTFGKPLTNVVMMGMGEPLLNYKHVKEGLDRIIHPEGLNFAPKRITLSTAGIAKMIKKLADDEVKFHLALSLHAANDEKRNEIMPINETNNLTVLMEALVYFYEKTGNDITFEYIMLRGVNDGPEDAKELLELCKQLPVKVNLIEYNKVEGIPFKKSERLSREKFQEYLEKHGVTTRVRMSRGKDIDAACGQLANKSLT